LRSGLTEPQGSIIVKILMHMRASVAFAIFVKILPFFTSFSHMLSIDCQLKFGRKHLFDM
jgi:hypothetical protein